MQNVHLLLDERETLQIKILGKLAEELSQVDLRMDRGYNVKAKNTDKVVKRQL